MSVRRERAVMSDDIQLKVYGEWTEEAAHEASKGAFDQLVLHRGQQKDFSFLPPIAAHLRKLWIDCDSDSSAGLEQLPALERLYLSCALPKPFDFRCMSGLRDLRIECWEAWYAKTLFAHPLLESLHIQGYSGLDAAAFVEMPRLASLSLTQGKLRDLAPLSRMALSRLQLGHLKGLSSIGELGSMNSLQHLLLNEGLSGLKDLSPIQGLEQLETLVVTGAAAEVRGTAWLRRFTRLRELRLQSGVVVDHMADLFVSPYLKKLAVVLAEPIPSLEDAALHQAAGEGRIQEVVRFGTKKRPALLITLA